LHIVKVINFSPVHSTLLALVACQDVLLFTAEKSGIESWYKSGEFTAGVTAVSRGFIFTDSIGGLYNSVSFTEKA